MDYASSVQAVALRVCKLDASGAPLTGTDTCIVTDQFTQVSWTPEYKTGTEYTQDAANGTQCVYYKMPDTLTKVNLQVAICNPQPEFYAMMADGAVLLGSATKNVTNKALAGNVATLTANAHGFLVGDSVTVAGVDATFDGTYTLTAVTANTFSYAKTGADVASTAATGTVSGPDHGSSVRGYAAPTKNEIPNEHGLGLEVWSRRIVNSKPAGDFPFWRWVFPFANLRMDGERQLGNGVTANAFAGDSVGNADFGLGPAADWTLGSASAMQFAMDATAPTGTNGYVPIA